MQVGASVNRLMDSHMYQEKTAQEYTVSNYENNDTSIIGLLEKEDYVH